MVVGVEERWSGAETIKVDSARPFQGQELELLEVLRTTLSVLLDTVLRLDSKPNETDEPAHGSYTKDGHVSFIMPYHNYPLVSGLLDHHTILVLESYDDSSPTLTSPNSKP